MLDSEFADHLARIKRMKDPDAGTWDLSPNDRAAIAAVLERLREWQAKADELREEVKRVRDLIDRDRTGLAEGLNKIRQVVTGYSWLARGEWGSYSYEEHTTETLRKEIGWAFDAISELVAKHLRESGARADAAFRGGNPP